MGGVCVQGPWGGFSKELAFTGLQQPTWEEIMRSGSVGQHWPKNQQDHSGRSWVFAGSAGKV